MEDVIVGALLLSLPIIWIVSFVVVLRVPAQDFDEIDQRRSTVLVIVALFGWVGGLYFFFVVRPRIKSAVAARVLHQASMK
jgi:hypothetical protein